MRRIFALAAVAALLTGCAQLPRSGAIGVGPDVQVEATDDYLYYSPSLPSPGDSQQQIVTGFLSAGNGPQNDRGARIAPGAAIIALVARQQVT